MLICVFTVVAFLMGCFCGIKLESVSFVLCIFNIWIVFAVKLIIFRAKSFENFCAMLLIAVFCIGSAVGIYHDYKTFNEISKLYGHYVTVTGTVSETDGDNFVVDTEFGRIKVYNYIFADAEIYDTVKLTGVLEAYETAQYNGDFDTRLYNALKGIVGSVTCESFGVTGKKQEASIWNIGARVRERIENTVMNFHGTSSSKGFVTALLTGSTEKLDEDVQDAFRLTGISHILAVSGLHVGIFLSFFIVVSRGIGRNKISRAIFMTILVIMYVILIGERASVFRAAVMSVVSYIMFAMKRRSDSLMNLMIAGLLICSVNPYYVTDLGFQLSFMATLGLVLFMEFLKYPVVTVPVTATLFMLPFTLYSFNTVSFTTLFANVIGVFLVPFVILTGYIGLFIPFLLKVSLVIAEAIVSTAKLLASLECLHFTFPSPDIRVFLMWLLMVFAVYFLLHKAQYRRMLAMLLGVIAIYANGAVAANIADNGYFLRFINCGNYNMQHITTEAGKEIFVYCGTDANDYAVKNGIDEIFAVIIPENRETRYKGLEELCSKQRVKYVLLPEDMKNKNLKLEKAEVLYYNQDSYEFYADKVKISFEKYDDYRYMHMKICNDTVLLPLDKDADNTMPCTIMCVPEGFEGCTYMKKNNISEYYVHSSYVCDCQSKNERYITEHSDMLEFIFLDNGVVRR